MKKVLLSIFTLFIGVAAFAQPIPADSLFLGQTPPGDTPTVFPLQVVAGSFAAERIAITNDGKTIFYHELDGYSEMDGKPHTQRIKQYNYTNGKWSQPVVLFEGFGMPALSITGDTLYCQKVGEDKMVQAYFSVKDGFEWSAPRRFLLNIAYAHYYQATNSGNHYISSAVSNGIGRIDRCRLLINGTDTTAIGLGRPINAFKYNLDYYVALDESFMVTSNRGKLGVSYPKTDGCWTNPKLFGPEINFGLGAWGTYVTSDNKYLFFTSGTKEDYSDTYVRWVRIDKLVDSLRHTNNAPYLKVAVANQECSVGKPFSYTIPEGTFFDDDASTTFLYSATLADGSALPSWLNFNPATRSFCGTPVEAGSYNVSVVAIDQANAFATATFTINATGNTSK